MVKTIPSEGWNDLNLQHPTATALPNVTVNKAPRLPCRACRPALSTSDDESHAERKVIRLVA